MLACHAAVATDPLRVASAPEAHSHSVGRAVYGADHMELVGDDASPGQNQLDGTSKGPVAVPDYGLDSGPDLVVELEQTRENGSLAAPFGEVEDHPSLGVGENGVELKAPLERAFVDRQHSRR